VGTGGAASKTRGAGKVVKVSGFQDAGGQEQDLDDAAWKGRGVSGGFDYDEFSRRSSLTGQGGAQKGGKKKKKKGSFWIGNSVVFVVVDPY